MFGLNHVKPMKARILYIVFVLFALPCYSETVQRSAANTLSSKTYKNHCCSFEQVDRLTP
jgi:hypothetical protein